MSLTGFVAVALSFIEFAQDWILSLVAFVVFRNRKFFISTLQLLNAHTDLSETDEDFQALGSRYERCECFSNLPWWAHSMYKRDFTSSSRHFS